MRAVIPEHTKCDNCGECCYFILATKTEISKIQSYVTFHNIKPIKHKDIGKCCFRDEKQKKCLIYAVRPTICRLFGVTRGMECKNGNTANLDMSQEINFHDTPLFLNNVFKK